MPTYFLQFTNRNIWFKKFCYNPQFWLFGLLSFYSTDGYCLSNSGMHKGLLKCRVSGEVMENKALFFIPNCIRTIHWANFPESCLKGSRGNLWMTKGPDVGAGHTDKLFDSTDVLWIDFLLESDYAFKYEEALCIFIWFSFSIYIGKYLSFLVSFIFYNTTAL